MANSITFLGITFHFYGLIISTAILVAALAVEKRVNREKVSSDYFWNVFIWTALGGVIGARVWHVFTDWQLYWSNLWAVFQVWNGGMSILGAVLGGVLGLLAFQSFQKKSKEKTKSNRFWLDAAMYGVPIGQVIGRLGNYVNQELYGVPSNLPWAIEIDLNRRLVGYGDKATYHPLFLYEMILTGTAAVVIWYGDRKGWWKPSQGNIFIGYLFYYAVVRVLLDAIRLQKPVVFTDPVLGWGWGINQLILITIIVGVVIFKYRKKYEIST